jgi:hypothetical protein
VFNIHLKILDSFRSTASVDQTASRIARSAGQAEFTSHTSMRSRAPLARSCRAAWRRRPRGIGGRSTYYGSGSGSLAIRFERHACYRVVAAARTRARHAGGRAGAARSARAAVGWWWPGSRRPGVPRPNVFVGADPRPPLERRDQPRRRARSCGPSAEPSRPARSCGSCGSQWSLSDISSQIAELNPVWR